MLFEKLFMLWYGYNGGGGGLGCMIVYGSISGFE